MSARSYRLKAERTDEGFIRGVEAVECCAKCGEDLPLDHNPCWAMIDGSLQRICPGNGCKRDQRWGLSFKMKPWNV